MPVVSTSVPDPALAIVSELQRQGSQATKFQWPTLIVAIAALIVGILAFTLR